MAGQRALPAEYIAARIGGCAREQRVLLCLVARTPPCLRMLPPRINGHEGDGAADVWDAQARQRTPPAAIDAMDNGAGVSEGRAWPFRGARAHPVRLTATVHFRLVPPSQMKIAWLTRSVSPRASKMRCRAARAQHSAARARPRKRERVRSVRHEARHLHTPWLSSVQTTAT